MVKDISNVFHHIKNIMRRCCVGGDVAILIFGSFENDGGYCKDSPESTFLVWPFSSIPMMFTSYELIVQYGLVICPVVKTHALGTIVWYARLCTYSSAFLHS